jgi:hypothetical protein
MNEFNSETYNIPDLNGDVVIISDEFLLDQNDLHCSDLRDVRSFIEKDNTDFEYDWDNSIFENHSNDDNYYGANTTLLNQIIFNQGYYRINIDNIPDLDSDVEFLLNQNELHCNDCILINLFFNYM